MSRVLASSVLTVGALCVATATPTSATPEPARLSVVRRLTDGGRLAWEAARALAALRADAWASARSASRTVRREDAFTEGASSTSSKKALSTGVSSSKEERCLFIVGPPHCRDHRWSRWETKASRTLERPLVNRSALPPSRGPSAGMWRGAGAPAKLAGMQGSPPPTRADVRLRLALDAAELGTWYWDAASGVTVWDRQMRAIFGVGPDWSGTFDGWVAAFHPLDRAEVLATLERALGNGERYEVSHRVVRPDGTVRWIEGLGQAVRGDDGEVTGTIGCARDITSRVERDERLAELAGRARRVAEQTARLQAVTADLATALSLGRVTELLGRHLPRVTGAARTALALRTPDARGVRILDAWGYPPEALADMRVQRFGDSLPMVDAVSTRQALFVGRAEVRERYPVLAVQNEKLGGVSMAVLPLHSGDEAIGALALGFAPGAAVRRRAAGLPARRGGAGGAGRHAKPARGATARGQPGAAGGARAGRPAGGGRPRGRRLVPGRRRRGGVDRRRLVRRPPRRRTAGRSSSWGTSWAAVCGRPRR